VSAKSCILQLMRPVTRINQLPVSLDADSEVISMVELIVAVSAAILVSALCSLLEAVLYAAPDSHIEALAQDGRAPGRIFRSFRQSVDRPISAILSLNTIAHTAGAVIAGAAAASVFSQNIHIVDFYFPVFFTLSILIFSEVIPKTIGVVYSRPLVAVVARPLQIMVWVFTPMIWLCQLTTRVVSKGNMEQPISEKDLVIMARMGQRTGTIQAKEAHSIQNILSLKSRTVRDVMTPRTVIFALSKHLTVAETYKEMDLWTHSRVPIYANDSEDIVGVLLRQEVVKAIAEHRYEIRLSELMQPVHFVLDFFSLDRVLEMFLKRRQHLFVAINEYGDLKGVVTLEDVLEEILGREIVDEGDQVINMRKMARGKQQVVPMESRASTE